MIVQIDNEVYIHLNHIVTINGTEITTTLGTFTIHPDYYQSFHNAVQKYNNK